MSDPLEITPEEALLHLKSLRAEMQRMYKNVDRKRTWRPSEKAMTKAKIAARESALLMAIRALEAAPTLAMYEATKNVKA